jgi:hypothetical protein
MHPLRYTHRQFGITSFNYKIKMKTLQKNYIMMLWCCDKNTAPWNE